MTDFECERCYRTASVPADCEVPEHGLCWTCASDEVTVLRQQLADRSRMSNAWKRLARRSRRRLELKTEILTQCWDESRDECTELRNQLRSAFNLVPVVTPEHIIRVRGVPCVSVDPELLRAIRNAVAVDPTK